MVAAASLGIREVRRSLDGTEIPCIRELASRSVALLQVERGAGQAYAQGRLKQAKQLILRARGLEDALSAARQACRPAGQ